MGVDRPDPHRFLGAVRSTFGGWEGNGLLRRRFLKQTKQKTNVHPPTFDEWIPKMMAWNMYLLEKIWDIFLGRINPN